MARLEALLLVSLAVLLGCQTEGQRFVSAQDGISFVAPDGWQRDRVRGSLVFSAGDGDATIVVRAVPVPERQREHTRRSFPRVVEATKHVLSSLPDAVVFGPFPDVHGRYLGARLAVSFQSENTGRRYDRHHVVLLSTDRSQIVHVFVTAPSGSLGRATGQFDELVAGLRKES